MQGFQSTHSLRSATTVTFGFLWTFSRFNPRTPCGVRLAYKSGEYSEEMFQSTHSLRSATFWDLYDEDDDRVSIHALLAECDCA